MVRDLLLKNRSYRRFDQGHAIPGETLRELVDCARLAPCGNNKQSLKFYLSCDGPTNATIFSTLAWARSLPDWTGPAEGERPGAYIVICNDTTIRPKPGCDHGIAAQSMLLAAAEKGLGGCMIGSVQRERLHELLRLPPHLDIALVLALGKPAETVVIVDVDPSTGSTTYYRDEDGVHCVPKRSVEELIVDIS